MKIAESVGNMVASCFETACQFTIGQFLIRMLDRCIDIIEKTAQWSLPQHEIICEENGKSFKSIKLIRPLPWILFLPGLVILRGFRFTWNTGAFIIGYFEMQPSDIVKSLQKVRRRLRTIRTNGVKRMRKIKPTNSRDQNLGLNAAKQSLLQSIQLTLSTLSCFDASKMKSTPPPMRIRVPMNYDVTPMLDDKSSIESTMITQQYESKRKYSEVSSDDPTSDKESECEEITSNAKSSHDGLLNSSSDPDFGLPHCTVETNDLEDLNVIENEYDDGEVDELMEEARLTLMEDYKKINPEMTEEQMVAVVNAHLPIKENKTAENGNGNCYVQNKSDGLQDYYSPCKSIEDPDMAFYSPVSSKSTSPDREMIGHDTDNVLVEKLRFEETGHISESTEFITNEIQSTNHDEKNNKSENEIKDDEKNDLTSVKGKQQRQNVKGKRNTHGNRKKKSQ